MNTKGFIIAVGENGHPDYYRSRYKKKNEIIGENMIKLQEITSKFDEFQCCSLEAEYKTSAFNEEKMKSLVEDLNKLMNDYITELKNEAEDVSKPQH